MIDRSLRTAKHSVSASSIKYSASWLPTNGIWWRACWKCFSRKYQTNLEKETFIPLSNTSPILSRVSSTRTGSGSWFSNASISSGGTVSLPLDHEQGLSTVDFLSDDPLNIIGSKDFRLSVTHSGSRYHNSFKILIKAPRWTTTFLHLFSSSSSNKMMLTEGN